MATKAEYRINAEPANLLQLISIELCKRLELGFTLVSAFWDLYVITRHTDKIKSILKRIPLIYNVWSSFGYIILLVARDNKFIMVNV